MLKSPAFPQNWSFSISEKPKSGADPPGDSARREVLHRSEKVFFISALIQTLFSTLPWLLENLLSALGPHILGDQTEEWVRVPWEIRNRQTGIYFQLIEASEK